MEMKGPDRRPLNLIETGCADNAGQETNADEQACHQGKQA
jgi:hypothetical protein